MLHAVKTTNLSNMRSALLGGLLFVAVLALLPISAGAQCSTGWDASAGVTIIQRGTSWSSGLSLKQKGRVITGRAYTQVAGGFLRGSEVLEGTVDGTIDGDSFSVHIYWDNNKIGVYNGKILPSGRVDGEAYEKSTPQSRTIWHSEGVLKCAPPPPPVIPKPIKSSGKRPPTTQPPATPPPTPPFIVAGQPIIPPYAPYGIVPLGWEGGPDHPNVEVWLSMDNGAEIPAFSVEHVSQSPIWKQPKASIQLHLQRYHHYRFVLKSGGKTLSTAAFVVQ